MGEIKMGREAGALVFSQNFVNRQVVLNHLGQNLKQFPSNHTDNALKQLFKFNAGGQTHE